MWTNLKFLKNTKIIDYYPEPDSSSDSEEEDEEEEQEQVTLPPCE
jgi:hypothetical protein